MKILRQESPTKRIVQMRWYLPAIIGGVICRQRKCRFFWHTTSWLYTYQKSTIDDYVKHFDWEEKERPIGRKQF